MIYKAFFGVGGGHTDIIEQNILKKGGNILEYRERTEAWHSA